MCLFSDTDQDFKKYLSMFDQHIDYSFNSVSLSALKQVLPHHCHSGVLGWTEAQTRARAQHFKQSSVYSKYQKGNKNTAHVNQSQKSKLTKFLQEHAELKAWMRATNEGERREEPTKGNEIKPTNIQRENKGR
ncbi:hypothetical protein CHARACLAT_000507 [Characodon lateralis]|uniref:Uncharacterized protein n=1 Tax=Characodon lateralis TaxID=208331 RepID=A0ABU7ESW8_9TELE|nr:hypothetical protein [Characodon lateralis]